MTHHTHEEQIVKSQRVASIADLEARGFEVGYVHLRKAKGDRKHYRDSENLSGVIQRGGKLSPRGGVSVIELKAPLRIMSVGGKLIPIRGTASAAARCNDTDKFDRKFGTAMATRRGLLAMAADWQAQAEPFLAMARELTELAGGPAAIEETPEFKRLSSYGG